MFALVLLTGVGTCIYFVGNISATLPPIKEYEYRGDVNQLITKMKLFASTRPHLIFSIGEILGNKTSGYAYDITIKMKDKSHDLLYELKFEDTDGIRPTTKLLLIGAHDLTNNTGGYGLKAIGMKLLLDNFDSDFLIQLKNIDIVILTSASY
ncbi:MAG: hypothetical protein JWQ54_4212 [Mucilaginibacter sp.]|nr:hypothetical protein [Mucilaginibacter sp.]